MRRYLVEAGVPADRVVADHAGFDTYDSCSRAQRVFGVERLTVVTQDYHLPRAVATCRALGLDVVGVGDASFRGTRRGGAGRSATRSPASRPSSTSPRVATRCSGAPRARSTAPGGADPTGCPTARAREAPSRALRVRGVIM